MEITVTARSGEISEGIKEYAARKLRKLEHLLRNIESVQITEAKERAWHIVEITLLADGLLVRGQERGAEMRAAIDLVVDKLERQIKKYREKLNDRARHSTGEPLSLSAREGEEGPSGRIVRSKRFAMKPMSPDEAAAEMELLGHDFFVFTNAETDEVNVIYRRRDGNYGLIEPEF